jgi:hypothetical protein
LVLLFPFATGHVGIMTIIIPLCRNPLVRNMGALSERVLASRRFLAGPFKGIEDFLFLTVLGSINNL